MIKVDRDEVFVELTRSICPVCKAVIDAQVNVRDDRVYLRKRCRLKSVHIKQHNIECSLLEGVLTRGDRRIAAALEEAWRRGCRSTETPHPCRSDRAGR